MHWPCPTIITSWHGDTMVMADVMYPMRYRLRLLAGGRHSVVLLTSGSATAWGNNDFGQCNIPYGMSVSRIAAGAYHTLDNQ